MFSEGRNSAIAQTGPSLEERNRRWEERQRELEEDRSKSHFFGRLGDFVVVPTVEQANDAELFCPPGNTLRRVTEEFRPSELNSQDMFSQTLCQDGTVARVYSRTGRMAYFKDSPRIFLEAPRDRMELTNISGKPALIVEPPADPGPYFIFVIERQASPNAPGILVAVLGHRGLQDSINLTSEALTR